MTGCAVRTKLLPHPACRPECNAAVASGQPRFTRAFRYARRAEHANPNEQPTHRRYAADAHTITIEHARRYRAAIVGGNHPRSRARRHDKHRPAAELGRASRRRAH